MTYALGNSSIGIACMIFAVVLVFHSNKSWVTTQLYLVLLLTSTLLTWPWMPMSSSGFLHMNYSMCWIIGDNAFMASPSGCACGTSVTTEFISYLNTATDLLACFNQARVSALLGKRWLHSRHSFQVAPPLCSQVQNMPYSSHGKPLDLALLSPLKHDHLSLCSN